MSFFLISADPESVGGDTLTCGVCKKEFALADIVKFIQHKVLTCNKENYSNCNTEGKKTSAENGSDSTIEVSETTTTTNLTTTTLSSNPASAPTAASVTLTGRRHSISTTTPVTEVKSLVTAAAAVASGGQATAASHTGVENNNLPGQLVKTELESRRNKVECVDAESNTVNSGKALIFRSLASWDLL